MQFERGRLVFTRSVNDKVAESIKFSKFVLKSLRRFASCDWGELDDADKRTNDEAVVLGDRLLGAYETEGLPKIWIITEWDRSVTTVLFPDEY